MARFGMRTWRYLAAVWIGAIALELGVLELAKRTNSSWVLLLGVALLLLPIIATERTFQWLGRAPRKRWKRHDLEDELARGAQAPAAEPARPAPPAEPPGGWRPGGDGRTRRP